VSSRKAVASSLELLLQPVRSAENRIIVTATIEDCLRFIFILLSQLRLMLPFKATAILVEELVFLQFRIQPINATAYEITLILSAIDNSSS
jgi:hypothetical protein